MKKLFLITAILTPFVSLALEEDAYRSGKKVFTSLLRESIENANCEALGKANWAIIASDKNLSEEEYLKGCAELRKALLDCKKEEAKSIEEVKMPIAETALPVLEVVQPQEN